MSSLKSKVAIITGAGSGIGRATAVHFASLGCYLALNDLNSSTLEETRRECIQSGLAEDKIFLLPGDITEDEVASEIVSSTVGHFSKLDILVNNAGIFIAATMENCHVSDLEKMLNVNLVSAFRLIQFSIPHLKETRGCIVNVSSVASCRPVPFGLFYSSTKAALSMLTKSVAVEVSKFQIRVNAVCPGGVKSNISSATRNFRGQSVLEVMGNSRRSPDSVRIADPLEIAKPIAFLCSDDASFVTGSTLYVDGGSGLRL